MADDIVRFAYEFRFTVPGYLDKIVVPIGYDPF